MQRATETATVNDLRFRFRAPNDLEFRQLVNDDEEENERWIKTVVIEPDMSVVDFDAIDGKFVLDLANACKEFVMKHYGITAGNES